MYAIKWLLPCASLVCGVALAGPALGNPRQAAQSAPEQSQGQAKDQTAAQPPSGQASSTIEMPDTESEITTRTTDTQIKVHVNVVLVRAVVRDTAGKEVAGLKKEDFKLLDNGEEQKITTFNEETAETRPAGPMTATVETNAAKSGSGEPVNPSGTANANMRETKASAVAEDQGAVAKAMPQRFVALVFDDLHMKANESLAVRAATEKLFAGLAPTDRAAVYSTSGSIPP
jgi:hypothetical protein